MKRNAFGDGAIDRGHDQGTQKKKPDFRAIPIWVAQEWIDGQGRPLRQIKLLDSAGRLSLLCTARDRQAVVLLKMRQLHSLIIQKKCGTFPKISLLLV